MFVYSSISVTLVTHLNAQSSPESKTEITASEQLVRASQLPKIQPILKPCSQDAAICNSLHRQELKWHHTVYEPAGGGHPHLALPDFLRLELGSHVIDDVLSAEPLVRGGLCVVGHCVDGLCHVTVWFGLPNQDLAACCFHQIKQVTLLVLFERSQKIEVASIKQLRQLCGRKKKQAWIQDFTAEQTEKKWKGKIRAYKTPTIYNHHWKVQQ